MRKTANDWILTIASGVFSYQLARLNPGAATFLIISAIIAITTILTHIICILFFEKKYLAYRWWITGICCGTNLLIGLIIYLV